MGADIGVGCVAASVGILGVAWLWMHERGSRKKLQEQSDQQTDLRKGPPQTHELELVTKYDHIHETDARPMGQELEVNPNEIPDTPTVNLRQLEDRTTASSLG